MWKRTVHDVSMDETALGPEGAMVPAGGRVTEGGEERKASRGMRPRQRGQGLGLRQRWYSCSL